jgi:ATP-dependent RNA helicase DeaD
MRLPTIEDVNAFRVSKFTDAIGQALGDDQIDTFRELVAAYERDHDVPAVDIAAAIAVLAQDGEPLLLEDVPQPVSQRRDKRSGARGQLAPYRIEVGRKQRVEPRQIVGALANEGGLSREDFGKIDIRPAFSIVELPADLPADTLRALRDTRISGVPIDLKPDRFARTAHGERPRRPRSDGDTSPKKKPRHKNRVQ